ncbi:MAG: glycosyltransferase family 4 protein [Solobacterium sp.]|nr:glycosyltransferase family 4 protein [Solobacterium sp.]
MKKLAFVIPWYAANITGGAESELRGIVTHLTKAGVDLEVLTTCVKQFNSDWGENFYPEGIEVINGVTVRRFPVRKRDAAKFDAINIRLMNNQQVSAAEEKTFMEEFVNSPLLYKYIKAHKDEYALFIYIPYMFSTNYYGILACPEKSVLIPCFHEEAYIHMDIYRKAFESVRGMIYLSKPEHDLANQVFDLSKAKQIIAGAGVDTEFESYPEHFREKYNIREPFILYAGRKDVGKNIYLLIQYYAMYIKRHPESDLKLVLIGGGDVTIPERLKDRIIDLGFVDLQDKHDACAAASLLCNPSVHESFSIVIMESWLGKRPVMVHEDCAVTKNFCRETNGGLWFKDYFEFEGGLDYILTHEDIARTMGENGREYVLSNFSWNRIVEKLMSFFSELTRE